MKKQWRWLVFIVFIACFGISNTMVIADNVGSTENTSLSGSPENKTDNKTSDQNSVSSASSQSDGVNNSSTVSSSNSSSASSASSKRSIPKNNILAVSSVNWPKRFATWTQGERVSGTLSRNKYGFMNGVYESADGLHKYVGFNIMAHIDWTQSPKTQFYALYETNGISLSNLDSLYSFSLFLEFTITLQFSPMTISLFLACSYVYIFVNPSSSFITVI